MVQPSFRGVPHWSSSMSMASLINVISETLPSIADVASSRAFGFTLAAFRSSASIIPCITEARDGPIEQCYLGQTNHLGEGGNTNLSALLVYTSSSPRIH